MNEQAAENPIEAINARDLREDKKTVGERARRRQCPI